MHLVHIGPNLQHDTSDDWETLVSTYIVNTSARWCCVGGETDIDAAWDAAKDEALLRFGNSFSGKDLYGRDFVVHEEPRALEVVLATLNTLAPGAHALSVARASDWKIHKVRLVLSDAHLKFPEVEEQRVALEHGGDLTRAVEAGLSDAEVGLGPDEVLGEIRLVRHKSKYQSVVTRNEGPSEKRFVVVSGDRILSFWPSATLARRSAREIASPEHECSVFALSGREGGEGLVKATQHLAWQRANVTVNVLRLKNPERNRQEGWLFVYVDEPA